MSTVTVCIPSIPPRSEKLLRALASVVTQTRPADAISVIFDYEGIGAAAARNKAWCAATTEYVAFLDDDDEFLPQHLERVMECAVETNADVVYSWFEHRGWPDWTPDRQDPLAVPVGGHLRHPLGVPFGSEQAAHMKRYAFIPITTLVRRSMLERVGGFPQPLSSEWPREDCEEWGCWLRILDKGGRFVHHPERTWVLNAGEGTAGKPWKEMIPG